MAMYAFCCNFDDGINRAPRAVRWCLFCLIRRCECQPQYAVHNIRWGCYLTNTRMKNKSHYFLHLRMVIWAKNERRAKKQLKRLLDHLLFNHLVRFASQGTDVGCDVLRDTEQFLLYYFGLSREVIEA